MLVFRSLNKRIDVRYDQRIYEATVKTLLDVIPEVEKKTEQIFLVGHNPGLEELLRLLSGAAQPMDTASLAKLSADISEWNECESNTCVFHWLETPGLYKTA